MPKRFDISAGPSQRQQRVAELVRHALAEVLSRGDLRDEVLISHVVTVPEVRMSPDLKLATAYVMPLGGRDEAAVIKALDKNKKILRQESGLDSDLLDDIIRLGQGIRRLDDAALRETASTRALIATATLVRAGLQPRAAAVSAIASPLTDDAETCDRLTVLIESYL